MKAISLRVLAFAAGFLLLGAAAQGQTPPAPSGEVSRLERGIYLYSQGLWRDAVLELRRAQGETDNPRLRGEALYWIILAEMGGGEYEGALRDMDELEMGYPEGPWSQEAPYHKGRIYYSLGRFDEGFVILKNYADSLAANPDAKARRYAALFWSGECLFSLGQLDMARDVYSLIINEYPQSVKYEAANYRIALINQKNVEKELLGILKWSHEESLKTVEEYQRRERSYEQAIIAYQKRIAELLNRDSPEPSLSAAAPELPEENPAPPPDVDPGMSQDQLARLLALRSAALELLDALEADTSGPAKE